MQWLISELSHAVDHPSENDKWTRMGIDATVPLPRAKKYERATMMDVNLSDFDIEGA